MELEIGERSKEASSPRIEPDIANRNKGEKNSPQARMSIDSDSQHSQQARQRASKPRSSSPGNSGKSRRSDQIHSYIDSQPIPGSSSQIDEEESESMGIFGSKAIGQYLRGGREEVLGHRAAQREKGAGSIKEQSSDPQMRATGFEITISDSSVVQAESLADQKEEGEEGACSRDPSVFASASKSHSAEISYNQPPPMFMPSRPRRSDVSNFTSPPVSPPATSRPPDQVEHHTEIAVSKSSAAQHPGHASPFHVREPVVHSMITPTAEITNHIFNNTVNITTSVDNQPSDEDENDGTDSFVQSKEKLTVKRKLMSSSAVFDQINTRGGRELSLVVKRVKRSHTKEERGTEIQPIQGCRHAPGISGTSSSPAILDKEEVGPPTQESEVADRKDGDPKSKHDDYANEVDEVMEETQKTVEAVADEPIPIDRASQYLALIDAPRTDSLKPPEQGSPNLTTAAAPGPDPTSLSEQASLGVVTDVVPSDSTGRSDQIFEEPTQQSVPGTGSALQIKPTPPSSANDVYQAILTPVSSSTASEIIKNLPPRRRLAKKSKQPGSGHTEPVQNEPGSVVLPLIEAKDVVSKDNEEPAQSGEVRSEKESKENEIHDSVLEANVPPNPKPVHTPQTYGKKEASKETLVTKKPFPNKKLAQADMSDSSDESDDSIVDKEDHTWRPTGAKNANENASNASEVSSTKRRSNRKQSIHSDDLAGPSEIVSIPSNPSHVLRVLAQWSTSWYPGTIIGQDGSKLYRVVFDDGSDATLPASKIRRFSLKSGQTVASQDDKRIAIRLTVDVDCPSPDDLIDIEVNGQESHMPISKIWIRRKNEGDIEPLRITDVQISRALLADSKEILPRKSRNTSANVVSATPYISSGLFKNFGFVITAVGGKEVKDQKDEISRLIQQNGGLISEDVFGFYSKPQDLTSGKIELLTQYSNHKIYAIVCGETTFTPKYWMALSLRIPCVSPRYVFDAVQSKVS